MPHRFTSSRNPCPHRRNRVKILHIIGSVDPRGGGTTDHVFSSCRVWSRHGHECHILCLDPPNAVWVNQSPALTFALGRQGHYYNFVQRLIPAIRYGYEPNLVRWLREYAPRYDAVILNGLWNYTSYGSWLALKTLDVPYFVCPHGMLDPWLKTAHPMKHFFKTLFWKLFESNVLSDARGVFFACEEERLLAGLCFLRSVCSSYVVGFGTQDVSGDQDTQKAAFLSKFPQVRERKLILFLSRLHPKKGLDLLIRAFALHANEFPEFDLLVAGPDQSGLVLQLTKIATELGIQKRIHWTGMLKGDEKWGAFRVAEFFVLPSHQENFGIAVAEAMALAVPVLITNKVNIWREIQSSGAGHVVADEIGEVAKGLQYMCSLSRSQLLMMGCRARTCFLERFDLERNAMELLTLITTLSKQPYKKGVTHEVVGS